MRHLRRLHIVTVTASVRQNVFRMPFALKMIQWNKKSASDTDGKAVIIEDNLINHRLNIYKFKKSS